MANEFYTIGYGGRLPTEFVRLLTDAGVRTVADVRLRPDRSSMGSYKFTGKPTTGIEKLLADAGIGYASLPELGNLFLGYDDSLERYGTFFERVGDLLLDRLRTLPGPVCLLCAEKDIDRCHRKTIADRLAGMGHEVRHLSLPDERPAVRTIRGWGGRIIPPTRALQPGGPERTDTNPGRESGSRTDR